MTGNLGKEYLEHKVFGELTDYADFYKSLSFSTMSWISQGTRAIVNLDTYVFSSIQGTLESINDILRKGRINDSYALLRKYYDSAIINIYSNLYLQDNFSLENFVVEKIDDWRKGSEKIPSFKHMSQYIIKSPKTTGLTNKIYKNGEYKGSSFESLRQRCNEHLHYFYYENLLSNDNKIFNPKRPDMLDDLSKDITDIFILHLAYLFYINDHYMMSSDYRDSLDLGISPEEGSQYFVAPFIQEIFDKVIQNERPDLAIEIKSNTEMKLK